MPPPIHTYILACFRTRAMVVQTHSAVVFGMCQSNALATGEMARGSVLAAGTATQYVESPVRPHSRVRIMLHTATGATELDPERVANQQRFSRDLEFLSALSNPYYLHQLSQQGYFEDEAFLHYLEYLDYFRAPRYVKYLTYPQSLYFLDLLKHEAFRSAVADSAWPHDTAARQMAHWATWRDPANVSFGSPPRE